MIIYEVNCLVSVSVERKFLEWLREHVKAIVSLSGVMGAQVALIKLDDRMDATPDCTGFCVRYQFENRESLDLYLSDCAQKLRQEGIDLFSDKLTIYRRVLGGSLFEVHH